MSRATLPPHIGPILNGPLKGRLLQARKKELWIGGLGYDPRPGPQVEPCPLGNLHWLQGQGWKWTDRKPTPAEACDLAPNRNSQPEEESPMSKLYRHKASGKVCEAYQWPGSFRSKATPGWVQRACSNWDDPMEPLRLGFGGEAAKPGDWVLRFEEDKVASMLMSAEDFAATHVEHYTGAKVSERLGPGYEPPMMAPPDATPEPEPPHVKILLPTGGQDKELDAIFAVQKVLEGMDDATKSRIFRYLEARWGHGMDYGRRL